VCVCVCVCVRARTRIKYTYIFSYSAITSSPLSGTANSDEFVACPADGRRMAMEHL